MPPKKRRKKEYSAEEWKVQRGRRYRKKAAKETKDTDQQGSPKPVAMEDARGAGYMKVVRDNALFEKYYQGQGFISEEEWEGFVAALREDLPVTFRITGTRSLATHVLSCLQRKFFVDLEGLQVEGEKLPAPKPLPWYPGKLAWCVPLSKKFIRKSPLVSKFHGFLVRENSQGNISRQEAVSMIPPLLLDVKPSHKVLDMCAAPGSKTAQLIEFLHAEDTPTSPLPSGIVLANDANNKRCYMLVHQAKRLNSPCLMVANHDASVFPMLYYHDEADIRHPFYYDRILCDVPCSGDGTMRKNPSIWKSWNPLLGPSLHKLQLRILNRGLELLAPGGRLVYSTCSLNPIENEAVIGTALSLCKGAVKLVDCRSCLEGLKTMTGLSKWKVMTKEGEWLEGGYSSVPKTLSRHLTPTMFPPDNGALGLEKCVRVLPHYQDTGGFFIAVLEKAEWLPWQAKMKKAAAQSSSAASGSAASQSSDTKPAEPVDFKSRTVESDSEPDPGSTMEASVEGGVANVSSSGVADEIVASVSLQEGCVADVSSGGMADGCDPAPEGGVAGGGVAGGGVATDASLQEESLTETPQQAPTSKEERPSVKILGRPDFASGGKRVFKEDPYIFFDKDTDFFDTIKPYYGLPDGFPLDQLLTRTRTGKKKNLYLSSRLVKELTIRNEHVLKIINIGVKVMSRCSHPLTPCSFRLCQEGVDSLVPYISSHCVRLRQEDLSVLLEEANPLVTSLTPYAQEGLQTLGIGPVVFVYIPDCAGAESAPGSVVPETSSGQPTKGDGTDAPGVLGSGVPVGEEGSETTGTSGIPDPAGLPVEGSTKNSVEIPISCPIHLSGWLAAKSARLFLDKNYRYHFLSMLGHDPPTNQCLDTINASRSGRDQEEEEECGDERKEGVDHEGECEEDERAGSVRDEGQKEEGCNEEGLAGGDGSGNVVGEEGCGKNKDSIDEIPIKNNEGPVGECENMCAVGVVIGEGTEEEAMET